MYRDAFSLFVSQDGTNASVRALAESLGPRISYLNHIEDAEPEMPVQVGVCRDSVLLTEGVCHVRLAALRPRIGQH